MLKLFKSWFALSGWLKILIALLLGAVVGLVGRMHVIWLAPIGNLFINAIHMLIAPVVFSAIVCAILSVHDGKTMRRISFRAVVWYVGCMIIASCIGLFLAHWINPGHGINLHLTNTTVNTNKPNTISSLISNLVPSNPVQAFINENVLQIVVFAILLGLSVNMAGDKGKPIAKFFFSLSSVAFKLAEIVMKCAPYGVFALIAWTFARFGFDVLLPLVNFIITVYVGCALMFLVVYGVWLWIKVKVSLPHFMRAIASAVLFAFTTSSSAATLPISMHCCEENLHINKDVSRFLLPLGASFNLNGLSIYLTAAVVFAANLYGIHLSLMDNVMIVLTTVITAMGAAAVPGSALVVMGAIMTTVHIPLGAIALIAGIDRINDMAQTATNVAGDIFVTTMVADSEGKIGSAAAD